MNHKYIDLISLICRDHHDVQSAFALVEDRNIPARRRYQLLDHACGLFLAHAAAEEQYLYPLARTTINGGEPIVAQALEQHSQAEALMKQLSLLDSNSPSFDQMLSRLIGQLRRHMDYEETRVLPQLARTCSPAELQEGAAKMLAAKDHAPTRPHPAVPHTPLASKIFGPAARIVDRVRDSFSNRTD